MLRVEIYILYFLFFGLVNHHSSARGGVPLWETSGGGLWETSAEDVPHGTLGAGPAIVARALTAYGAGIRSAPAPAVHAGAPPPAVHAGAPRWSAMPERPGEC